MTPCDVPICGEWAIVRVTYLEGPPNTGYLCSDHLGMIVGEPAAVAVIGH